MDYGTDASNIDEPLVHRNLGNIGESQDMTMSSANLISRNPSKAEIKNKNRKKGRRRHKKFEDSDWLDDLSNENCLYSQIINFYLLFILFMFLMTCLKIFIELILVIWPRNQKQSFLPN